MAHEFVILNDGKLKTYIDYDDIPEIFDHVIKFVPEVPEPPHTNEQHEEMEQWPNKLKQLMKRELK